jgi:2-polyprenyl-3-methyl-5-hydroxy-6-metoxy-1,4-benzoquinol methylase
MNGDRRMLSKLAGLFRWKRPVNFIGFDKYRLRGAYHWREVESNQDYRRLIEVISGYLKPTDTVLDIGCGDGAYLGFVAGRIQAGWGIDAEEVAIELARAKFKEKGISNCHVQNMLIEEAKHWLESNGQKFDVVWSADVIEHLPRPEELLELAVLATKPQTNVIIGTPLYIRDDLVSPYHIREYTRQQIEALLDRFFVVEESIILPQTRKDGKEYVQSYYLGVCSTQPIGDR